MNNQHCWYKLNLDTSQALREDWIPAATVNDIRIEKYPAEKILNQAWLDYTVAKKIYISNVMIFNRPAWQCDDMAHIDLLENKLDTATYSINWVLDCDDSEMIWFNRPASSAKIEYTPANTPYSSWPIKELVEIDRCNIRSGAVLTRVDVPHAVSVTSQSRLSIAARSSFRMPWNLAVAFLRANNMLIERD